MFPTIHGVVITGFGGEAPAWHKRGMNVADIMTRDVEFVLPTATVAEAAEAMGDLSVGALPVGTAADLQGIVTDRDILFRVVAIGASNSETLVADVMTPTIYSCRQEDRLTTALDLMAARNVRRLPVLDAGGTMVGLVTLADLSRHLLLESQTVQEAVRAMSGPAV